MVGQQSTVPIRSGSDTPHLHGRAVYLQYQYSTPDSKANLHNIPQSRQIETQVMSLSYVVFLCSLYDLVILLMPYILGTPLVLTSLLADAAFHAAQVSRWTDLIPRSSPAVY